MADAAAGDVVVGGDDQEDGFGVADAGDHEVDVVDAAFEDRDLLVVDHLREKTMELGFVAAVGVDFVCWGEEQVFDCGGAAVACAA